MGQDNKGPKLHFFLCEIFLANNQPILDNIFFEFSFFLCITITKLIRPNQQRETVTYEEFSVFLPSSTNITIKANLGSYQLVLDVNVAV